MTALSWNREGLPSKTRPIHFIGIGGIGMSGIAEILLNHGYKVQGSDQKQNKITERLSSIGARIFTGHVAEQIRGAGVVVVSSAIEPNNPELTAAHSSAIPVMRRAEMLAELMRLQPSIAIAGTHGKTTTTSLVAALLDHADLNPTVINGGIIHAYGSNARAGKGLWMVVEADESDGTFTRLPTTIALVTNIDPEHMEHWGSEAALHKGFFDFISNIPFYGLAVCCTDDPVVQEMVNRITGRRVLTFGLNETADVRGYNLHHRDGSVHFDIDLQEESQTIKNCRLPMPGAHNVTNALGAVGIARHLGIGVDQIREGLAGFKGVNRRFTTVGDVDGITIIDDYAHHPVEIAATLNAARKIAKGRVIAIHQPHRFTRLQHHFEAFCTCFQDADVVGIADVFAAGEAPLDGATRDALVAGIRDQGQKATYPIKAQADLVKFVQNHARSGDIVLCMGAGTISAWATSLLTGLSA